jgi:alpha-tubulin suppressor-like RCC1 family protein
MPSGVEFTAAAGHFFLDTHGNAWAWYENYSATPAPVSMPPGVSFTAIAAGSSFVLALDTGGNAWAWGNNDAYQLGNGAGGFLGDYSDSPVPVSMPAGVRFTAVAVGATSLALDTEGRAWAWGEGQLGNGIQGGDAAGPVSVSMPFGVSFTDIGGGGELSLALDSHGNVWSWGNSQADANPGVFILTPTVVEVPAGVSFTAIAGGGDFSVALDTGGRAWAWGNNQAGQLGTGTIIDSFTPVAVNVLPHVSFSAIAAGDAHSLGLDIDGQVWAWGSNALGQLGNGEGGGANPNSFSTAPVLVSLFLALPGGVYSVAAADAFSLALGPPMPRQHPQPKRGTAEP